MVISHHCLESKAFGLLKLSAFRKFEWQFYVTKISSSG